MSPSPNTASSGTDRSTRAPLLAALVVIAILLAVIVGLLLTQHDSGPSSETAPGATPPGQAPAIAAPTSAPSVTDPAALEVMHAEVKRDPADNQAQGELDAPVVMVIYSDFGCPFCTKFAQEVEPNLADLVADGTLRIEWRDLAQITETSALAAQAGVAAANQGRFWEFHDAVYGAADPTDHPAYTEDSLVAFAQQAGVPDLDLFRTDMTSSATVQAVEEAKAHAYSIGIESTPFMIVGDAVINGALPVDFVRATIMEQARAARG